MTESETEALENEGDYEVLLPFPGPKIILPREAQAQEQAIESDNETNSDDMSDDAGDE